MSDTVRMWLGIIGTAVVVYLILSPNMRGAQIIQSLSSLQVGAIEALQGRS